MYIGQVGSEPGCVITDDTTCRDETMSVNADNKRLDINTDGPSCKRRKVYLKVTYFQGYFF